MIKINGFISRYIFAVFLSFLSSTKVEAQELKVDYFASRYDITGYSKPRQYQGKDCAFVKVLLASSKAIFEGLIVGDIAYKNSEYYVYMLPESKRLVVKLEGCLPLEVKFEDYGIELEGKKGYVLKINIIRNDNDISEFKKKNIYIEPQIQLGGMTAFGASIGGYINHINVEASYMKGFSKSEEIFWNDNSSIDGAIPYSYTYEAARMGVSVGYGIYFGKYFCISPQVGMGSLLLSGTEKQKGDSNPSATKGYATNMTIGAKMNYIFSKHFGVMITPEYSLAISKSNLFERVSEVSDKVKSFATGFNVRIGVFATF